MPKFINDRFYTEQQNSNLLSQIKIKTVLYACRCAFWEIKVSLKQLKKHHFAPKIELFTQSLTNFWHCRGVAWTKFRKNLSTSQWHHNFLALSCTNFRYRWDVDYINNFFLVDYSYIILLGIYRTCYLEKLAFMLKAGSLLKSS